MNHPKVFEFAKELGMETLALMDKIREWKLPIKNHMAELDEALIEQIRSRILEESAAKQPAKKAKTVKKKATTEKAVAEAPVKAKAEAGEVTPAAEAKPKPVAKATPTASTTGKKAVATKKVVSKVIRRKAGEPTEAELEAEAAAAAAAKAETTPEVEAPPVETETPSSEESVVEPAAVVDAAVVAATTQPESTPAEMEAKRGPARKKEVVLGPPSTVPPRVPPRRNIVGRMDLSRVTPPPREGGGPSQSGGGMSAGGGMGFGTQVAGGMGPGMRNLRSTGPRNLRAGFVAPTIEEHGDPELDDRKSRFEEKPKKKPREREEEITTFSAADFRKRELVFQPKKKKVLLNREAMKTEITTPKASKRVVRVQETMKVADFAQTLGIKVPELIKKLMGGGVMATINTDLDFDTIALIAPEYGFEAMNVHKTVDDLLGEIAFGDLEAEPISRPPVVTVMGHVDHGKTTLLDSIRKTDVASGEAGGITQHIGAYSVKLEDGHQITFIDTPGHEAFTAMRARGAHVTDVAIIVVAADDGMMPQTQEAVSHAKAAEVPIIVAVNKIDKPGANPDRIKQQLAELELVPEEWGGDTIFCNVSALKKQGIKELLEQIAVSAEGLELKANPKRSATGIVIESRMDKGRGAVATLLVQDGTLKAGQSIVAGGVAGKVRAMMNYRGERVDEAGPSMPVEIIGLPATPAAGDRFDVCRDEDAANRVAAERARQAAVKIQAAPKMTLEELFSKVQKGDVKELPVVLKTDVAGSVEAIRGLLDKLATDEIKVKIIHSAVGGITESDVLLASTANGVIIGFNVRPDGGAVSMAKQQGVEIKTYSIVYELVDDVKKSMAGMLSPDIVEKALGRAEVRNTFSVPKIGMIAGCFIVDGKITRNSLLRLVRDGRVVYEGKISSLKRFKDDAREVASGFECGIGIENFNDIKVGDVIEAYMRESVAREL